MQGESVWRRSLIGAFVAFAVWEVLKHLLLMDVPMFLQHGVSAIIEVGLALVIVVLAVRALSAQQRELDRMRDMRDKLASALANDLRQPLLAVVEALNELEEAPELPQTTLVIVARAVKSVRPLVGMAVELLRVTPLRDEAREFQLLSMKRCPLDDQPQRPRRQPACQDREVRDSDAGLLSPIPRVEVRRSVIAPVHVDSNPEELAQLRHDPLRSLIPECISAGATRCLAERTSRSAAAIPRFPLR